MASYSYPSPAERVGRVAVAKRRSGGGCVEKDIFIYPHPGSHSLADPPHKGEGKESQRALQLSDSNFKQQM